jgi:predicted nucleic acid-binding protein
LSIDLAARLRRRKPERRLSQVSTRDPADLPNAEAVAALDRPIQYVPDTTVYIHAASGRLPPGAREIMRRGLSWHCSVCLGELAAGLGARNPRAPKWPAARDYFAGLFDRIPETRVLTPDAETLIDASLLAGMLARTQGLQRDQRKAMLNDALILMTAARRGLPVMTANRAEFDLLQQLAPEGRFIFY